MKLIVAGHKGGIGKTTFVINLAILLMYKDLKVGIIKADKNPDLLKWNERREEKGLPLVPIVEAYGDISKDVKRLEKLFDVVLIDVAGHDSSEFRSGLSIADALVTLVRPSAQIEIDTLADVTKVVREIQHLKNPALEPWILFTRCKTSPTNQDASNLAKDLKSDPIWLQPLKQRISQLDVYELAVNEGMGVHEIKSASSLSKAKGQLELVATELKII
jgi:chromosome partitioning protein